MFSQKGKERTGRDSYLKARQESENSQIYSGGYVLPKGGGNKSYKGRVREEESRRGGGCEGVGYHGEKIIERRL